MNKSAVRYKIYKYVMENNLPNHYREALLSETIGSKIAAFFGMGGEVGSTLAKAFKNKELQALAKSLKKDFASLKALSSKVEDGDKVVADLLKSLMDGASIDSSTVDSADPAAGDDKSGGGSEGGTPSGKPVDPGQPAAAVPTLAAAAAQAAGQDEEKAKEQAEEKKVTPDKATEVLAKAIASKAGVEPKAAAAIIKALIDTGHMLAEGRRRKLYVFDFKNAINELRDMQQHSHVFDRWSSLAGISTSRRTVLKEGRTGDILKDIKAGKITSLEELEKAIEEATKDGKGQKVLDRKDEIMAAFKEKVPDVKPEDEKAAAAAIDDAGKGGEGGGGKEDAKATEEAKKKFGAAFDDVQKKVGDAADEAAIAAVLAALDELDSLKIA